MNKYSVRKYYFIDTVVEANDPDEANDKADAMPVDLSELQYLGDLEFNSPDIAEV